MKAAGAGLRRGNVLPVQSPFLSSREAAKSGFAQAACIGHLRSTGCAPRNPSGKGAVLRPMSPLGGAVRHKDTARSLPSIYFILSPPNYAAHFPAASPPPRLRPLPRTRGPLSPTTAPGSPRAARPLPSPLRRRNQGLRAASGPGHTAPSPAKPS